MIFFKFQFGNTWNSKFYSIFLIILIILFINITISSSEISALDSDTSETDLDLLETDTDLHSSISASKRIFLIQSRLLDFILSLFDDELPDSEYASPLISSLAILGISEQNTWIEAKNYTPILSGTIAFARLFVLQKSKNLRVRAIRKYGLEHSKTKSYFEYTKILVNRFLVLTNYNGISTPFNWLIKIRSYGFKIRYNITEVGSLYWNDEELFYQDIQLSISNLREFIHSLVYQAQNKLYSELLFIDLDTLDSLPELDLNLLKDNPTKNDIDWCFLNDSRNNQLFDASKWLYSRILKNSELIPLFIRNYNVENRTFDWNLSKIEDFLMTIRQFKEILLLLVHFTSGGPARGPEILSIRYKNTEYGGIRNIFIENGIICLVTSYNKGYNTSAVLKIIHRYIPKEISILLVYYLWLIIPFEFNIRILLDNEFSASDSSPFLWPEKARPRDDTSPIRKRTRRQTLEPSELDVDIENENDSEIETETTDKTLSFFIRYNSWTGAQISQLVRREFMSNLGLNITLISWRHIIIAIFRKFVKNPLIIGLSEASTNPDINNEFDIDNSDNPIDLQAGHSSRVGEMVYGRDINELSGQTASRRDNFYYLSTWLHRFFLFESAKSDAKPSSEISEGNKAIRLKRWKRFQKINLLKEFQYYFGSEKQFRGLQEDGLKLILKGTSPILIIMGTGRGKSLFFLLPTLISTSDSLSIIIVPLISLRHDLLRRCNELNIRIDIWNYKNTELFGQILLITPESVFTSRFSEFLGRQKIQNRLDRIYLDECHVILDARPDFRPKLLRIAELLTWEIQIVYLTATLPPQNATEWFNIAGINPKDAKLLRENTRRSNIRYSVINSERNTLKTDFLNLIQTKTAQYPYPNQIIIYCGSIDLTKSIGNLLKCPIYYSDIPEKKKTTILQRFSQGSIPLIAATSALGLGLDNPNIRVVFHLGYLRLLRDFSQESGRAGRDNQKSEAILIREINAKPFSDPDLENYSTTRICRRAILDSVIDGRTNDLKCQEIDEKCDLCAPQAPTSPDRASPNLGDIGNRSDQPSSDRNEEIPIEFEQVEREKRNLRLNFQKYQTQSTLDLTELSQKIFSWNNSRLDYLRDANSGNTAWAKSDTNRSLVEYFQKNIKFDKYSGCFQCGLPQSFCSKWTEFEIGKYRLDKSKECQYPTVLFEFSVVGLRSGDSEYTKWMQTEAKNRSIDLDDVDKVLALLGKKYRVNGIETNELCRCFWTLFH